MNIDGWIAVTEAQSGSSEYWLKIRPGLVLEAATFLTTVATAIILFWAINLFDRKPAWGQSARDVVLTLGTCFGAVKLFSHVARATPWIASGMQTVVGENDPYRAFTAILVVIGCGACGLLYCRTAFSRVAGLALVVVLPIVVTNVIAATWTSFRLAYRVDYSGRRQALSLPARHGARARLVWAIFDEMDGEVAFEQRPPGLELTELDRLRSESVFATNAKPAGQATVVSIPSLTTGRRVRLAVPRSVDTLELEFIDDPRRRTWRSTPNIFTAAHSMGVNTALVGWYHPYCRIFGDLLASCDALPVLDVGVHFRRRALADVLGLRSYVEPHLQYVLGARSLLDPEGMSVAERTLVSTTYAEINASIWKESLSVIADSRFDFVFVHVPLPHLPGLRRAQGGSLLPSASSCYVGNFTLVDALMGEWRRALQNAGLWDSSTLLVTSDHSLRPFWKLHPFWTDADGIQTAASHMDTVPLLIKMPGQDRSIKIDEPIETGLLYRLSVGILRGEFRNKDQVAAWIRDCSTKASNGEAASGGLCGSNQICNKEGFGREHGTEGPTGLRIAHAEN